VFAVADTLDAMTSDRPYRTAGSWETAGREILRQSAQQFDPDVVRAFGHRESGLRAIQRSFAAV
jgi:HD-GYP domain-containing protein (c-di-GMP phosphodiesterase class II)